MIRITRQMVDNVKKKRTKNENHLCIENENVCRWGVRDFRQRKAFRVHVLQTTGEETK